MQLKDLPAFTVEALILESADPRLVGRFSHLRGVQEGRSWLYAGDESLIGDLEGLERTASRAVFIAPFWSRENPIQIGSVTPWVDGRWQAYQIKMIVDPDAVWRRETFVADDAQHFRQGRTHGWTKAGAHLDDDAVPTFVQPRGWDHEECQICDTHIGRNGLPYGYIDREGRWLCEKCHERYAARRRLDFMAS